jgi:two-component system chemotaxis sensor kinase CheA
MDFHFDMTAEDIKVFLDEADEQLQVMEAGILRLEKEGENLEVLQEVFRAAHTLKGSSATLGHRKMAEVTHSMESVLDKVRKRKLQLQTQVVDTLFAGLDLLVAFKEEVSSGQECGVTTDVILGRLNALESGDPPQRGTTDDRVHAAVPTSDGGGLGLSSAQIDQLRQASVHGLSPMRIVVGVNLQATMPAVRAFQVLLGLEQMGEVLHSDPTLHAVEEDQVSERLTVLLLANRTKEEIRAMLDLIPDMEVLEIAAWEEQSWQPAEKVAAVLLVEETAEDGALGEERSGGPAAVRRGKSASRTIRVDVEVLDNLMSLVGELVIDRTRLLQVLNRLEVDREGDELTQVMGGALAHIGRMTSDLQEEIQRARMLPVENLFRKFPRMVRHVAQKAGKEIEFIVLGEETELDRSVIEEIGDPLMHLLRNGVDHGVEPPMDRLKVGKPAKGKMTLEAFHEENHIIISIRDDGRGMDPAKLLAHAVHKGLLTDEAARRMSDPEAINLIWIPGFSTAEQVSDISGRGVGLDVVHKNIEKLNGSVEIKSELGQGTEFRVKLPLTLAIIRSLQIKVMDTTYCIPLGSVVETDRIPASEIQTMRQRQVIVKRGEVVPLIHLVDAFDLKRPEDYVAPSEVLVAIVAVMGKQIGLVVDDLIGEGDVVIKPLGKIVGDVPGISGATILGDGDVAIIMDVPSLINTMRAEANRSEPARTSEGKR